MKSRKTADGLVEQTYLNLKNEELIRHFKSVRMGVSWPAVEVPGAFVTIGQQFSMDDPGENTLELLSEYELTGLTLEKFFNEIVEYYQLYGVEEIYLNMDEDSCFLPWQEFTSKLGLTINFVDAPFKEKPFAGISTIKDLLRRNKLKLSIKSKVREQASKLELQDLNDELSQRFPLVGSLRHVISGFIKDPPRTPIRMLGGPQRYIPNGGSWMAT
jgi:hypothetical protein